MLHFKTLIWWLYDCKKVDVRQQAEAVKESLNVCLTITCAAPLWKNPGVLGRCASISNIRSMRGSFSYVVSLCPWQYGSSFPWGSDGVDTEEMFNGYYGSFARFLVLRSDFLSQCVWVNGDRGSRNWSEESKASSSPAESLTSACFC